MTFPLFLALLPLGAYFLMLGGLRLMGRPLVTTGARDLFTLGAGVSGLMAVGPAELFFPSLAGQTFGPAVWPMLASLYFLMIAMVVLNTRPRLVVYGLGPDDLIGPLARACRRLDAGTVTDERAGTVSLPDFGVHLRIASHGISKSADIEAFEPDVAPIFWRTLVAELRHEVARLPRVVPAAGGLLAVVGLAVLLIVAMQIVVAPQQLVEGLREWLWR